MILWLLSHTFLKSKNAMHDFVTIPVLNSSCGALCHRTLTELWPSTVAAGKQDLDNTALAQGPASFKTQPPVVAMTKLTESTSSPGQKGAQTRPSHVPSFPVTSVNFSLFTFSERFREYRNAPASLET